MAKFNRIAARIRVDEPDDTSNYIHVHVYDKDGRLLDKNGKVVGFKDSAGHVPYSYDPLKYKQGAFYGK
ncbi:hypothetical protein HAU32_10250 [Weissella confusa]|uniref:Uncharacterized protein n=1 Tax=Weissella fermenti TaxID=2987699 RepID=A0ABT6D7U5_9LACO|nr:MULTISPECIES: hypothetical protein [Weissella]MBJ7689325.1 hypothetical protein [Weissella confusa]MDF9301009.1 hypothetical protein [Weissella sp. BK2]